MTEHSAYDEPARPYPGFLERVAERISDDVEPLTSSHGGAPGELHASLTDGVERRRDDLLALSHHIHANPELAFEEHEAAAAIARALSAAGHEPEVGAYGLPTALRHRVGSGHPRVAVLAEYDALPEVGHACGHNVIAATAVGAYLSLAEHADELPGSVELIGTPGEEGGGGKELIARAGGFDEIDAAVMLHPSGWEAAEHAWLGVRQVRAVYHGLAAHAAATPFLGRNALDAVVSAYTGMSHLRQHLLPRDRVHGVITDGGSKPNLVPDRAAVFFYLRSAEPETLTELCARAQAVFEGAATATGTRLELAWDPAPVYLPVRNNHALAARYAENMGARGRRVLPRGVVPEELTGSTDLGNVSMRVPAIHPFMSIAPPTVAIHDAEFADWARGERADRGTVDGAVALALTAADYLTDERLRAATHEEFEEAGGALDVDTLLHQGAQGPGGPQGTG